MAYPQDLLARQLLVYAVTDSRWLAGRDLAQVVEEAIEGGATFVQLREKDVSHEDRCSLARTVLPVCRKAGVPFVVDDDVACAQEVGADGVHMGQEDESCARARALLGPDAIVGVSAQTVEEARAAQAAGADYLGVGAIFSTQTKTDYTQEPGAAGFALIRASVGIPCVAIGGMRADNVGALEGTGAEGVAVVSAIFAAQDPRAATRDLRWACERYLLGKGEATHGQD